MTKLIAFTSPKGGTGSKTLATNIAAIFAQNGRRVCVVDICFTPEAFGLAFEMEESSKFSLNDYLWGRCTIEEAVTLVSPDYLEQSTGKIYAVLSSMKAGEQSRILREGYDVGLLNDGMRDLADSSKFQFDYIFIITAPGMREENLLSIAISDVAIINSDWKYLQTSVILMDVTKKLDVPATLLVLNMTPGKVFAMPASEIKMNYKNVFESPLALIPFSLDVRDSSSGVFAMNFLSHPAAKLFREIARHILEDKLSDSNTFISLDESDVDILFNDFGRKPVMPDMRLRVFLCHSSRDRREVRALYQRLLVEDWIKPWIDQEELLPGQDWELEIKKAVESSDVVILFVSNNILVEESYIQKEIRKAVDIANQKPDGTIFLINVRLENCEVPSRLSKWQWVDYFGGNEDNAYRKLKKSLRSRLQDLQKKLNAN